ncbi:helix-turn-helix domain-containing protein [Tautonia sp. JC769]|uniref:helix-turn-helix domain-containing protein n=1 Tax=Tautonia sp. JC769 TaxID=3232135 RepID=UPI0034577422
MKKYRVTLTDEERRELHDLTAAGKAAAKKLAHSRILLKADAVTGSPAWIDDRIAEAVEVSSAAVERVRLRFVEQGLEAALVRKPQGRPSRLTKLDGRAEARLVALVCSKPPDGRKAWTMKPLADTLVELQVVESTRVVAEHGRDRAVGVGEAIPGPADRVEGGGIGVGGRAVRPRGRDPGAVHHGRRPDQTPLTLPHNSRVADQ